MCVLVFENIPKKWNRTCKTVASLVICRLRLEIFPALNRITNGHGDSVTPTLNVQSVTIDYIEFHTQSQPLHFFSFPLSLFVPLLSLNELFFITMLSFQFIPNVTMFTDRFSLISSLFVRSFARLFFEYLRIRKIPLSIFIKNIIIYLLVTMLYLIFVERVVSKRWNQNDTKWKMNWTSLSGVWIVKCQKKYRFPLDDLKISVCQQPAHNKISRLLVFLIENLVLWTLFLPMCPISLNLNGSFTKLKHFCRCGMNSVSVF